MFSVRSTQLPAGHCPTTSPRKGRAAACRTSPSRFCRKSSPQAWIRPDSSERRCIEILKENKMLLQSKC